MMMMIKQPSIRAQQQPLRQTPAAAALMLLLMLAASPATQAQTIKPGLWEIQMQPQLSPERQAAMAQAQKQMAGMPAEQRKMMEDMMAKNGIRANLATGAVTMKVCITPEQAAANELPVDEKGKCSHQVQRSGKQIQTRFNCSEPPMQGESTTTLNSAESYSTQMSMVSQAKGKSETMSMSGSGQWLGSQCGNVAPLQAPGRK